MVDPEVSVNVLADGVDSMIRSLIESLTESEPLIWVEVLISRNLLAEVIARTAELSF